MRAPLLAGTLLVLLALGLPPAPAAAGVALHGVGAGVYQSNDLATTCANSPFVVEIFYLPDSKAVFHSEFAASCLGTAGLTAICCQVSVNTGQNPPVTVTFYCTGTEATGLACLATVGTTTVSATVGGVTGALVPVGLSIRGAYRFDGSFMSV